MCCGTDARASHAVDARACFVRAGVIEIWRGEFARSFAAIDASEEQSGGGFENRKRSALEEIGKANEDGLFAAADGESEGFVGIEIDVEAGRATFAVEAGVDALEKGCAAGDSSWEFGHWLGIVYEWGTKRSKRGEIWWWSDLKEC